VEYTLKDCGGDISVIYPICDVVRSVSPSRDGDQIIAIMKYEDSNDEILVIVRIDDEIAEVL